MILFVGTCSARAVPDAALVRADRARHARPVRARARVPGDALAVGDARASRVRGRAVRGARRARRLRKVGLVCAKAAVVA